jgi:RNA polymerase sigma-70 factor (ECF subfamily)
VPAHPSPQVNLSSSVEAPGAPSDLSAFAFRALFDAEFRYVWNTLRYLGVRPADVQDVGQEVFLTVHRKLSAGEVPRSTRSWLFSLCYHAASNYRQLARHRREAPDDGVPEAADSARDAEAHLAAHQESSRVAEVLDALDLDRRTVLVSHDMDEIPMPEIAEALGIPLNTAYSRLRLARRDFLAAARRKGLHRGAT